MPATDLASDAHGKARSYGIDEAQPSHGWVGVGTSPETAAFAVGAIRRWRRSVGQPTHPVGGENVSTDKGVGEVKRKLLDRSELLLLGGPRKPLIAALWPTKSPHLHSVGFFCAARETRTPGLLVHIFRAEPSRTSNTPNAAAFLGAQVMMGPGVPRIPVCKRYSSGTQAGSADALGCRVRSVSDGGQRVAVTALVGNNRLDEIQIATLSLVTPATSPSPPRWPLATIAYRRSRR